MKTKQITLIVCFFLATLNFSAIGQDGSATFSFSEDIIYFGDVGVGNSVLLYFDIINTGSVPIVVDSILTQPQFFPTWKSGVIPVGGVQTIGIKFTPIELKGYLSLVNVFSNAELEGSPLKLWGVGTLAKYNYENTTSVSKTSERPEVILSYPTVANTQVTIVGKDEPCLSTVLIINSAGGSVMARKNVSFPYTVDVSSFTPGQYSVVIKNSYGQYSSSFIKK
ncbi:MAG: hypothetical protein ABF289_20585 [Clostridiales bacterium]